MIDTAILAEAQNAASGIYEDFLEKVVKNHVFSRAERNLVGPDLTPKSEKEIADGKKKDNRPAFLASISGKGGVAENPADQPTYDKYTNVSLLDHLTSVTRGAVMLAAIDLRMHGFPSEQLEQRLATICVLAFLHDADKILQKSRAENLVPSDIAGLISRFGLDLFLEQYGAVLDPAAALCVIENVEQTHAGHLRPGMPAVSRELRSDARYIQIADRLDGDLLAGLPLREILKNLTNFAKIDDSVASAWAPIELCDPQSPFLLDALSIAISIASVDVAGCAPLLTIAIDGRLQSIVIADKADEIFAAALTRLTGEFGANIVPVASIKGKIDLLECQGSPADIRAAFETMRPNDRSRFLACHITELAAHKATITAFLDEAGNGPSWPDTTKFKGKFVPIFSSGDAPTAAQFDAMTIITIMNCSDDGAPKTLPKAPVRERELLDLLAQHDKIVPEQIVAIKTDDSRRAIVSCAAAAWAEADNNLHEAIDGLLELWMNGVGDRPGINSRIDGSGARLGGAIRNHFNALRSQSAIAIPDSPDYGRCHFTNAPVPHDAAISNKTGLYGVNISAFSGRDDRPGAFNSAKSETLVSQLAEAEHKLRQNERARNGSFVDNGVPVLVSSPVARGLFGTLVFKGEPAKDFTLYDALTFVKKDDRPQFDETALYIQPVRLARYEMLPERMSKSGKNWGQIDFILALFKTALRAGRPIHVFRGLPMPRREFVYIDSMPAFARMILGAKNGFRLEEIPQAIAILEGLVAVIEATGFGVELASAIADKTTRFSACCDTLARLRRRESDKALSHGKIRHFATQLIDTGQAEMTTNDRAIHDFAHAMVKVQRGLHGLDSESARELGMRVALEAAEATTLIHQNHPDDIAAAIAAALTAQLRRSGDGLYARKELRGGETIAAVITAAANIFVEKVWLGVFKGRAPGNRQRRTATGIYSHIFSNAPRPKAEENTELLQTA